MPNLKNIYPTKSYSQKQLFLKSCRNFASLFKDILPLGGLAVCIASLLSLLSLAVGKGWGTHVSTLILVYIQYMAIIFAACQILALLSNKKTRFNGIFDAFSCRAKYVSYYFIAVAASYYFVLLIVMFLGRFGVNSFLLQLIIFIIMLTLFSFYLLSYLVPFYSCKEDFSFKETILKVLQLSSSSWYRCVPMAFFWIILFVLLTSNAFIEVFPLATEVPFINVLLRIVVSFVVVPIFIIQAFLTINDLKIRMKEKKAKT